ncbi:MAG: hypothetical protein WC308_02815 [archaeon]|jgi:predicted nucleotidyltransferase
MGSKFPNAKKQRVYFPKRGPTRKSLMFLANLLKAPEEQRAKIYQKVLKSKKGVERAKLIEFRKALKSRKALFRTLDSIVKQFQSSNPKLEGIIIFGGIVKRPTPPTDLDIIIVGNLYPEEKRFLTKIIETRTGLVPDVPSFEISTHNAKAVFKTYLSKEIPYFSSPREWTVQNFFGSVEARRKIISSFKAAQKELISKNQLYQSEKPNT